MIENHVRINNCVLFRVFNYYPVEVNDLVNNLPIGIVLCTNKDSVAAEYAMGGL